MTSVCDTRLLLTFKFPPSQNIRDKIRVLLDAELKRKMIIPSIVIAEYIKIAGIRVGSKPALAHISELEARGASTANLDREMAVLAGNLLVVHPTVPMADAAIAATAKAMHADYVLSDDPHFKILGVKTSWL